MYRMVTEASTLALLECCKQAVLDRKRVLEEIVLVFVCVGFEACVRLIEAVVE